MEWITIMVGVKMEFEPAAAMLIAKLKELPGVEDVDVGGLCADQEAWNALAHEQFDRSDVIGVPTRPIISGASMLAWVNIDGYFCDECGTGFPYPLQDGICMSCKKGE